MAKALIKVNVAYPNEFEREFTNQQSVRASNGEPSFLFCAEEGSLNKVYVISSWDKISNAQEFWSSQEAKNHMQQWNSAISPEVQILREHSDS